MLMVNISGHNECVLVQGGEMPLPKLLLSSVQVIASILS